MLAERLHVEILKRVGAGEWPPGSRLPTEAQLCDMFEVSRPVVREALSRLRSDRVIETRQGSGSVVCAPEPPRSPSFGPVANLADLLRFYDFRIAIESETAALAALARTDADIASIEGLLDELDRSRAAGRLDFEADFRFHLTVADACRNQFFASAMRLIEDQTKFGMNLSDYFSRQHSDDRIAGIIDEHTEVLDAIRAGDTDAARVAMSRHLSTARQRTVGEETVLRPSKTKGD